MSARALAARLEVEVGGARNPFHLHVELSLEEGVLVLFGPSGSGKSLTLSTVVGLIRPKSGYLMVAGETVFDESRSLWVPAYRRRIGYVPQHHSLFPFCNVRDNVAFGLPRAERRNSKRVDELIEELGLSHLRDAMPTNLSGGERQRVALARALAVEPRLLVLDEPFASIDLDGRAELRAVLKRTLERHGIPALFVTHDPQEAQVVGDHLVRFERGRTVEQGLPRELLASRA